MRSCPKCGAKYEDTDLRSMCASCMVSLAPDTTAPATPSMTAPVPVTIGSPLPVITMAMPQVTMPEMRLPDISQPSAPPEIPQIDPAPGMPQPGPLPPPMTPQPGPDVPQPIIIPQPEPEPVPGPTEPAHPSAGAAELEAPPLPAPAEPPAPTAPASVAAAPFSPQPAPNLITLTASPSPPPPATVAPRPNAAATARVEPSATIVRRQLTAEERGASLMSAFGLGVGVFFCVIFVLSLLSSLGSSGSPFTFFWLLGMVILTIMLARRMVAAAIIHSVTMAPPTEPRLGDLLRLDVTIGTMRPLRIGAAEMTISARERASRSGGSKTRLEQVIFTRTVSLGSPPAWPGNSLLAFHPQLTLPANAMPSFTGRSNAIDWQADLRVEIPGWLPDIHRRLPLTIPALRREDQPEASATPRAYELSNLGDLHATLDLSSAVTAENIPILPLGAQVPFVLTMQPNEGGESKKLWVELVYIISGSGDTERVTISRVACFRNGWKAGIQQRDQGLLALPVNGPISYGGKLFSVRWGINVRMEIPWLVDRQQAFEIQVTPRAVTM